VPQKWNGRICGRVPDRRNAMKSFLMLGSCAFLALQIGTATAGPCTAEIESLSKILASTDAGSGPTAGATTNPGQHPPTAAMTQADPGTTASTSAAKSNQPQQPPTAAMNTAATNLGTSGATSRPPEAQPPTATMNQATKGAGAPGGASGKADASAALEQARSFDKAGQEIQCMDAVRRARTLSGS
jgi:hypothetical protein